MCGKCLARASLTPLNGFVFLTASTAHYCGTCVSREDLAEAFVQGFLLDGNSVVDVQSSPRRCSLQSIEVVVPIVGRVFRRNGNGGALAAFRRSGLWSHLDSLWLLSLLAIQYVVHNSGTPAPGGSIGMIVNGERRFGYHVWEICNALRLSCTVGTIACSDS
jgi:hypothetical protein